jgi:glycosyltransferase involved in cell wall biosynthesis
MADSGFYVQKGMIHALLDKLDWHFYFVCPNDRVSLRFLANQFNDYNVTLLPIKYSAGGPLTRFNFDANSLSKTLQADKYNFDIIYSNLPELIPNFLQLFNRKFHFQIPAMSYMHWIDLPALREHDGFEHGLYQMLTGVISGEFMATNTQFGKRLVLAEANKIFNDEMIAEVKRKVDPLYLGVPVEEMLQYQIKENEERFIFGLDLDPDPEKKIILFNHRIQTYTGFKEFLTAMTEIYEDRKDFQIVFTNASNLPRLTRELPKQYGEFLILPEKSIPYPDYVKLLWFADIVVGFHTGENQWSLSVLDAIACDTFPLVRRGIFFEEMIPEEEYKECFWGDVSDFKFKIAYILDNFDKYRKISKKLGHYIRKEFTWKKRVDPWIEKFEYVASKATTFTKPAQQIKNKTKLKDILNMIGNREKSKKDILNKLGWGTSRKWTKYDIALRDLKVFTDMGQGYVIYSKKPFKKFKAVSYTESFKDTLFEQFADLEENSHLSKRELRFVFHIVNNYEGEQMVNTLRKYFDYEGTNEAVGKYLEILQEYGKKIGMELEKPISNAYKTVMQHQKTIQSEQMKVSKVEDKPKDIPKETPTPEKEKEDEISKWF